MSPVNSSTKAHDIGIKPKFGIFSWELSVNKNKYDQVKCEIFRKEDTILFPKISPLKAFHIHLYFNSNPVHKVIPTLKLLEYHRKLINNN